ncbi:MAG: O-antigen ligase family protein [Bacteroidota bacterium]
MLRKIKLWVFSILVLMLLYNKLFEAFTGNDMFTHIDELFVGTFLFIAGYKFITKFRLDKPIVRPLLVIAIFIFTTLFSKYYSNLLNTTLCAFIHVKWFLIFVVIYEIYKDDYIFFRRLFYLSIGLSTFGVVINFIMQEQFNNYFNQDIMIRDDKLRMMGFEMHPNNLGILLSLIFVYYNFYNGMPSYTKILISTVAFALISIVFLGSRTPLIVVPLSYGYLLLGKKNKVYAFVVIILLSIFSSIALVLWGQSILDRTKKNLQAITVKQDESEYLRGIMIYNGFKIMYLHFPVGTGMATFGTSLSAGSKVYDDIKIGSRGVFDTMQGGAYDSNFASIAGEMGLVGVILLFWLLNSYRKFCRKVLMAHPERMHFINIIFLTVLVYFVVHPLLINAYPCMIYAVFLNMQLCKERYVLSHNYNPKRLSKLNLRLAY